MRKHEIKTMLKGLEQELQIEKPQTLKWLAIDEIAMLGE